MKRIIFLVALALIVFQGKTASIEIRSPKGVIDSVLLSSNQLNISVSTFRIYTYASLQNGVFIHHFPQTQYPQYITFKKKQGLALIFMEMLLEPTDSIVITLNENNKWAASGRGSEKWHCRLAFYALYEVLELKTKTYAVSGPADLVTWSDLFEKSRVITNYFAPGMSEMAKTWMTVDYLSMIASYRIEALTGAMRKNPAMDRTWIRQEIKELVDYSKKLQNIYNDSLLALTWNFPVMLKYAITLEKFSIDNKPEDLAHIYDTITDMCKGSVRNSILVQMLIRNRSDKHFYALAQKTLPKLIDPRHIDILSRIVDAEKSGNLLQFATFTDVSGKQVSLSNFKDTVILLDLWFTGCHPCMNMHKALIPLEARMKNKPFKMVTVSIDKNTDMWKTSIENGEYTNAYDLNLNTRGKGVDHPFFKHYQIQIYPTLMLIDKQGRLISTSVADPRAGKFEEMVAEIEALL
jgi:thiol-disulfide isomerase/thioredoxin